MANKKYLVGDENPIMPDSLKKNKKYVYVYDDGSKNTTTVTFKRANADGNYEFTDDRGSYFTLTHDETLDRVTESSDSIEDKVIKFFKSNPAPSDDEVHAFAEDNDMEPDDLEEIIYKLAGKQVAEDGGAATGGSVNGMGAVVLANGDAEGSGDVPTSTKKKKKKVRKFSEIIDEMEEEEEEKKNTTDVEIELTEAQAQLIVDIMMNPETVNETRLEILDEGIFGSILGGIGGLAFGKSIGKLLANTLGIKENSPLYNVLTSRLVGTAIGAALGKKLKF